MVEADAADDDVIALTADQPIVSTGVLDVSPGPQEVLAGPDLVMLIFGGLIVLTHGSEIAPFIYTIF